MNLSLLLTPLERVSAALSAVPPGEYDPATGHDPNWGKAAPAGLLIWLFLGIALFLLIKSMNRHLRRMRRNFGIEGSEPGVGAGAAGTTGRASGVGSVQGQPDGDAVAQGGGGDQRVEELVVAEDQRPAAGAAGGVEDGAHGVHRPADDQ